MPRRFVWDYICVDLQVSPVQPGETCLFRCKTPFLTIQAALRLDWPSLLCDYRLHSSPPTHILQHSQRGRALSRRHQTTPLYFFLWIRDRDVEAAVKARVALVRLQHCVTAYRLSQHHFCFRNSSFAWSQEAAFQGHVGHVRNDAVTAAQLKKKCFQLGSWREVVAFPAAQPHGSDSCSNLSCCAVTVASASTKTALPLLREEGQIAQADA